MTCIISIACRIGRLVKEFLSQPSSWLLLQAASVLFTFSWGQEVKGEGLSVVHCCCIGQPWPVGLPYIHTLFDRKAFHSLKGPSGFVPR